jgi:hypothetical protein
MRQFGGQQMTSGNQARVYANYFIANHLKEIGDGKTYSQAQAEPNNAALQNQVNTLRRAAREEKEFAGGSGNGRAARDERDRVPNGAREPDRYRDPDMEWSQQEGERLDREQREREEASAATSSKPPPNPGR